MIFENRVIILPKGDILSCFAINESDLFLYLNDGELKKKKIKLGDIVRCENLKSNFNCEYVYQISNDHLCKCINGNVTVEEI